MARIQPPKPRYRSRFAIDGGPVYNWDFSQAIVIMDRYFWLQPDSSLPGSYRTQEDWYDAGNATYSMYIAPQYNGAGELIGDQGRMYHWTTGIINPPPPTTPTRWQGHSLIGEVPPTWIQARSGSDPLTSNGKFSILYSDLELLNTGEWCSDWYMKESDFLRAKRKGYLISNPCLKIKHTHALAPIQVFFPVHTCGWDSEDIHTRKFVQQEDHGYCLVEIYLPVERILQGPTSDITSLIGYGANGPTELVPLAVDRSVFADFDLQLSQNTAQAAAQAVTGEIDLLTTAGEFPQTVEMFYTLWKRFLLVQQAYKRLRKGDVEGCRKKLRKAAIKPVDRRTATDSLKKFSRRKIIEEVPSGVVATHSLASAWLELRYGWRQLCFDARDALNALRAIASGIRRKSFSWSSYAPGSGDSMSDVDEIIAQQILDEEPLAEVTVQIGPYSSTTIQYWGKCTLIAGVGTDKETNLVSRINKILGGFNPIVTGWELIPGSFIWDWFYSFQSVIACGSVDPRTYTRQWRTVKYDASHNNTTLNIQLGYLDLTTILTDLFDDLHGGATSYYGYYPCCQMLLQSFNDEEGVVSTTIKGSSAIYLREVARNPAQLDVAIPRGSGLDRWDKVLDLVTIAITRKKIR